MEKMNFNIFALRLAWWKRAILLVLPTYVEIAIVDGIVVAKLYKKYKGQKYYFATQECPPIF